MKKQIEKTEPEKQITILVFCAWWGRPDVTFQHLQQYAETKKQTKFNLKYLAVISPEDEHFGELFDLARHFEIEICYWKNYPCGEKHAAGINYAFDTLEFDYLMNIGSDDLILPELFKRYEKPIADGVKFFGIMNFYFKDFYSNEEFFFGRTKDQTEFVVGAGRMIHREIIQKFYEERLNIYDPKLHRSLDTYSGIRIRKMGFPILQIDNGKEKLLMCLKCNTTISHIEMLKNSNLTSKIK